MSMINGIAAASVSLSSTETLTNVNVALMDKTLDVVQEQGQALQEMIESAAPVLNDNHLLDVYA